MPDLVNPIAVEQGATYVIVSPDGIRAVINDVTDDDYVGNLTAPPSGLERAGVRESADLLPEADGGVHGRFLRDRLPFTLSGIIPPSNGSQTWQSRQARLLRATDALEADATLMWTPSSAPPVQVKFREQQPTRITDRRPKTFLVAGVSADPAIYSQALNLQTILPTSVGGGGFASPLTSPLTSSSPPTGAGTVINAGQRKTWPELTFVGPAENPSVRNATLGRGLFLNYTLAAGERLVIDTDPRRRSIRLGGTANRYSALNDDLSAWFYLRPGSNDLRLGFTSWSGAAALEVRWRDAWG